MARHELCEAVHHRDDRLTEIIILHARSAPKPACAGHVAAMCGGTRFINGHRDILNFEFLTAFSQSEPVGEELLFKASHAK